MNISFITSYYNNISLTNEMIESLLATVPNDLDFELIIVNDASYDKTTPRFIEIKSKKINYLQNKTNLGFAMANNIGAKAATGNILFFINNDLFFLNGWIEPILKFLRQNINSIVGNVQQRYLDKSIDHSGVKIWIDEDQKYVEFRHATDFKSNASDSLNKMPAVTGACFAISRQLFESLAGFDEQFVNGCEDLDLCYRARKVGAKIELAYDSVVLHHVSATRGQNRLRDAKNSLRLFQKHPELIIQDIARQYCINALTDHDDMIEHRDFYKNYVSGTKLQAPIDAKLKATEIYFNNINLLVNNIEEEKKKAQLKVLVQEKISSNERMALEEFENGVVQLKSSPRMLTIETTSRCNLRCVMCPHGINAVDRPKHMDESLASKLSSFINQARHIQLHGIGEPLNSPSFWEMIKLIPDGCDASINTNLTTPDENKLKRLADSNILIINLSLDAATSETYQKIRGANLDICLNNLKTLVKQVKNKSSNKRIYINMTLMKSNIDEVKLFIDLAKDYQVDGVWLWHLNRWSEDEMKRYVVDREGWRFEYSKEGLWNYPELSNQRIREAFEYAKSIDMPIYTADNKSLMFE